MYRKRYGSVCGIYALRTCAILDQVRVIPA